MINGDTPQTPKYAESTTPSAPQINLALLLELVVRSALQKTGAQAAAVAFIHGDALVCRARAGDIAPDLDGVQDTTSGFTGACLRERRVLNCGDTHTDPRVNAAVCQELGIRSILAVPILRGKAVIGLIELLSLRARAFGNDEVRWLEEVAELIRASVPDNFLNQVASTGQQEGQARRENAEPEPKLADFVQLLQQSSPRATWDEIRQQLVSRS